MSKSNPWAAPIGAIRSSWNPNRIAAALPKFDANGKRIKRKKEKLVTTWRK